MLNESFEFSCTGNVQRLRIEWRTERSAAIWIQFINIIVFLFLPFFSSRRWLGHTWFRWSRFRCWIRRCRSSTHRTAFIFTNAGSCHRYIAPLSAHDGDRKYSGASYWRTVFFYSRIFTGWLGSSALAWQSTAYSIVWGRCHWWLQRRSWASRTVRNTILALCLNVSLIVVTAAQRHWKFASPMFRIVRNVGVSATAWNSMGTYFSVIWYPAHVIRQLEWDESRRKTKDINRKKHVRRKQKSQHQAQIQIKCTVLYRISFLTLLALSILNRWIPVSVFLISVSPPSIRVLSARVNLLMQNARGKFCEARTFHMLWFMARLNSIKTLFESITLESALRW